MRSVLETALLLAKRCDSYMEGFALRWSIAEFGGRDVMGGVPLESDSLEAARVEKQARHIFKSFMQGHDVPRASRPTTWNEFLPIINADDRDCSAEILKHGVLLVFGAPGQLRLLAGQEHGRTIPLPEINKGGAANC